MSLLVDRKYLGLISLSLDKFTQKDSNTWNARCPFCGDSQKSTTKARFYIYEKSGRSHLSYYCHNCHQSRDIGNLIKHINPLLYREYLVESFGNQNQKENLDKVLEQRIKSSAPVFTKKIELPSIQDLGSEHYAYGYLTNRGILKKYFTELYYTDDFASFVKHMVPETKKDLMKNDRRIIIPFYDRNNILLGFQGRATYKTEVRYISILIDENNPKIYGLNKINFNKRVYVMEGPFDSSFIENSVAAMDSALYRVDKYLLETKDIVYVYDNEPRNKDIVTAMKKTIDMGYKVCVWPNDIQPKDINDMVLSGYNPGVLNDIIDRNTFDGLKAKLELTRWSKI